MSKRVSKLGWVAVVLVTLGVTAYAGRALQLRADLEETCSNCSTDLANPDIGPGPYSLQNDIPGGYLPGNGVKSQILTHSAVYTLDTMNTLVNGVVGSGTRYVQMHFYSSVEGSSQYPNNVLPACWEGQHDQNQAVNWSIFSDNSVFFDNMTVGQPYPGRARMDFNVRNGACDRQIYRYYLTWYAVCITRTGASSWDVTSDSCGRATNYGEANLQGQGGRKKETINYGDWRMPFRLTLSAP
ncbi:MAG TPA: hypothetical protein VLE48_12835 [Terriglobales bacterium]|nr:hypothetical protein [Terriglobales bacterium]